MDCGSLSCRHLRTILSHKHLYWYRRKKLPCYKLIWKSLTNLGGTFIVCALTFLTTGSYSCAYNWTSATYEQLQLPHLQPIKWASNSTYSQPAVLPPFLPNIYPKDWLCYSSRRANKNVGGRESARAKKRESNKKCTNAHKWWTEILRVQTTQWLR